MLDISLATVSNYFQNLNAKNMKNLTCYKPQHMRESTGLFWKQIFKGKYKFDLFQPALSRNVSSRHKYEYHQRIE